MKIKRTNRITALVLALVMLSSMLSMMVYAEPEAEEPREPIVFANVDFEGATVNKVEKVEEEGAEPVLVDGTSIDPASAGLSKAHPFVDLAEDEIHGQYAVIPFRGTAPDSKTGSGNFDQSIVVQHPEVSYATTQGVIFELDLFMQYVSTGITDETDPTIEFQFASINHDKIGDNKTSTSFPSFAIINMKTGSISTSAMKVGSAGLKNGEWNKLRFELDLGNARFDIYVNGEKYATYGQIANNNGTPRNIVVPASKLIIAKCNKNKGAYVEDLTVASADMSYAAVDNIKFYENVDFIAPEAEPVVPYAIFNDSFQSKTVGMSPKLFGYYTPLTAVVAQDPTDASNHVAKVDMVATSDTEYWAWHSSNYEAKKVLPNADYNPEDPENFPEYTFTEDGMLVANVDSYGVVTGKVWGDDPDETSIKDSDFASYVVRDSKLPEMVQNKYPGSWYLVTGAMKDAMLGGQNVACTFGPQHPAIKADDYKNVVLNVDYYFSEDAVGKMEIQMNGFFRTKGETPVVSSSIWIDTITIDAKPGNDYLVIANGSNYDLVCGSAPTLKKGEWFTMSVVFDMKTGWEDIYFNGSYSYTAKPRSSYTIGGVAVTEKDFEFDSIKANSLSVGKLQRKTYAPSQYQGYFLVDNINFSTGEVLLGEQYEKNFVQNFDDLDPETVDFSQTQFGNNIPASVVLANESEAHPSVLKFGIGEALDEALASKPVLWGTGATHEGKVHFVAKVYDDESVLLEADLPEGEEAPEEAPDTVIQPKRSKYSVNGTSSFVLGTYAEYVNFWGKLADGTPAASVDKQWTFHNPGISYATKTRVAIDVELYIPEGASGVVQSQILKGAGTDADGVKKNFNYLPLYAIDLATGNVNVGAFVDEENNVGALTVGAWNNLSYSINMKTGEVDLYINNFYVGEGSIGYTDVAFYENTWILAKVARKQECGFAGYLMIDDARFFTVTNQLITVDANLENVVEVTFNGEIVPDGTRLFITEDVDYKEEKFDTSDYLDVVSNGYSDDYFVSVRTNKPIGLRFTSYVDQSILDELLAEHAGTVTFGTVILPTSSIETVENVTRPELNRREIPFLDVRTDSYFKNEYLEEMDVDVEGIFAGSIIGLKEDNLLRDFSAFGYVEIALESGGSIVIYTERMDANLAKYAQKYLDEMDDIPEDMKVILDAFAIGRYPAGYEKDY